MFDGIEEATGDLPEDEIRTTLLRVAAADKREQNREVYDALADE